MKQLISVITLTHNKGDYSRRCLASLLRTSCRTWELIVVDNGSTDGTREWLTQFREDAERQGIRVSLVLNDTNVGCSTARNIGIGKARGEKIVFVDNDVAVRGIGWMDMLSDVLDGDARVGMVGPKLVYPFPPHAIQFAGGAVSRSGRIMFVGRGEPRDDPRFNVRRDVQCFISACCMMKRSAVEATGYLDEEFNPVQYEDIDYSYRMRSRGYRIVYVPSVEMYHFESVTTAGTPSLCNASLVVRHGLLFKAKWKHMYEKEDGPSDEDTLWRRIDTVDIREIGELETLG